MTFQTSMVLREDDLRDYCTKLLNKKKISYFTIPDKFFHLINKAVPTGVRCWIYKIFGSLPDYMIFIPVQGYNLALMVELKRNGSYLRKNQKMASERLNWITIRTPEEFENTIDNLLEIKSHFLKIPMGIRGSDRSNSQKQAKNGKKEHVSGYR